MIGSNATISTKRIEAVDGKQSYSETYTLENVEAYIEPINAEAAKNFEENIFLLFTLIIDGVVDILISDLVVDDEGDEYTVKGVKPFKGGDVPSHTEAVIVKKRRIA